MEFLWLKTEEVVWIAEYKITEIASVYEDSIYSRRANIPQRIILAMQTRRENCIHEHVG